MKTNNTPRNRGCWPQYYPMKYAHCLIPPCMVGYLSTIKKSLPQKGHKGTAFSSCSCGKSRISGAMYSLHRGIGWGNRRETHAISDQHQDISRNPMKQLFHQLIKVSDFLDIFWDLRFDSWNIMKPWHSSDILFSDNDDNGWVCWVLGVVSSLQIPHGKKRALDVHPSWFDQCLIHPQCPCVDPSHIEIFIYYYHPHIIFTYYNPICNPLINLYSSIPIKILTDSTPGERSAGDWSSLWRAEEGVGLAQDESCKTQVADLRVAPGDTSLVAANSMAIRQYEFHIEKELTLGQKNDGDIGRPWNGRDTEVGGLNSTWIPNDPKTRDGIETFETTQQLIEIVVLDGGGAKHAKMRGRHTPHYYAGHKRLQAV